MVVFPLIPWTGALNLKQNPTLAHPSQLVQADDVVYDFDGTRHKRGGQSHRNRLPIPAGLVDDLMVQAPPGDWLVDSATHAVTHVSSTIWSCNFGGTGSTIFRRHSTREDLVTPLTMRVRLLFNATFSATTFFELAADTGEALAKRLAIRWANDGIYILTAGTDGAPTYTRISSANGAFNDFSLPAFGLELYDTVKYHTWRIDLSAANVVTIYIDEGLIFTSNAITNTASSGDDRVRMIWTASGGGTSTVNVDSVVVGDGRESVVTHLFDFPRPGTARRTVHRLVAVAHERVVVDPGNHVFSDPVLDNLDSPPNTLFSFAAFNGRLLIARTGMKDLFRWDVSDVTATRLTGSPPQGSLLRVHQNRVWVSGDEANPSRLYWSGLLNDEVWTAESTGTFVDSGYLDVDPDDGGIVTAIGLSFHNTLPIYKTTGVFLLRGDDFDTFTLFPVVKFTLGGVSHQAIVNVLNDQYFVSGFGVHSLLTTQKFGDLETALLSNDIRERWNEEVNPDLLPYAWALNNERFDRYELLLPAGVGTLGRFPNRIYCLHYGLSDELHPVGRWSSKTLSGGSYITFVDEDGTQHGILGSLDGFANRQDERFHHDFPVYKATPGSQVLI